MPKETIRLVPERMVSDNGRFQKAPGELQLITGLVPTGNTWTYFPAWVRGTNNDLGASTTAFPGFGLHIHREGNGTYRLFVAKKDTIYRSTNTNDISAWTDATGTGYAADATSANGWHFHTFGTKIFATNGVSTQPIIYAATPTTNFATATVTTAPATGHPVTYDPRPKFISSMKNRLVVANISFAAAPNIANPASQFDGTSYPSTIMFSAFDNPLRFGDRLAHSHPILNGSEVIHLNDDNGPITGIVGGDEVIVFKEHAIYRIVKTDQPPYFESEIIAKGVGTRYPFAIERVGNVVYFFGDAGLFSIDVYSGELVNLFEEAGCTLWNSNKEITQYSSSMTFNGAPAPIDIALAVNTRTMTIMVQCCDADQLSPTDNKYFLYSIRTKKVSVVSRTMDGTTWAIESGGFEDRSAIPMCRFLKYYPVTQNTLPAPYNDGWWNPDNMEGMFCLRSVSNIAGASQTWLQMTIGGGADPADVCALWPTPQAAMVFGYSKYGPGNGSSRIIRIRPIYETAVATFNWDTVTPMLMCGVLVDSRTRAPGATQTTGGLYSPTDAFQNADGWIELNGVWGNEHRISIEFVPVGVDAGSPAGPTYPSIYAYLPSFLSSFVEFDLEYEYDGGRADSAYS